MDRLTHIAPFGVAWEDLDLTRLEAFFADADEEPLTWEAKGGDPDGLRRDQIVKAVWGSRIASLAGSSCSGSGVTVPCRGNAALSLCQGTNRVSG